MTTLEIEPGNGTSFFSFFDPWINRVWRRGTLRIQQRGSRVDIRWSVIWERIIVCWFGMTSTCVFCEMCIKKVGEAQWYMEYHQLYMVYPGLYRYICYVIYIYTHTVFDYICNVYIIIIIYIYICWVNGGFETSKPLMLHGMLDQTLYALRNSRSPSVLMAAFTVQMRVGCQCKVSAERWDLGRSRKLLLKDPRKRYVYIHIYICTYIYMYTYMYKTVWSTHY